MNSYLLRLFTFKWFNFKKKLKDGKLKEIKIGIRLYLDQGFSFFGFEEVNDQIDQDNSIISIRPGGPLFEKVGEEDGNVSVTFMGFQIKVIIDELQMAS